jgi:hypothetical protein
MRFGSPIGYLWRTDFGSFVGISKMKNLDYNNPNLPKREKQPLVYHTFEATLALVAAGNGHCGLAAVDDP